MNNTFLLKSLSLAALVVLLGGCKKEKLIQTDILENIGNNIIVPTYLDVKDRAIALYDAVVALSNSPDSITLAEARQAWIRSRSPWEGSEAFLTGPVVEENIDPSVDSWPIDESALENILQSSQTIDLAFVSAQDGTLRGFHILEYILWGTTGNKLASEITPRQMEYALVCAEVLKNDCSSLYDAWSSTGDNYVVNLLEAGIKNGNSIYESQKLALLELINRLVFIADEVANTKIDMPYSQQTTLYLESRFSKNSKSDFSGNIRSILNVYTGTYNGGGDGLGLHSLVAEQDPDLDDRIIAEINDALLAIGSIPGDFNEAIFTQGAAIEDAQNKIRRVMTSLQSEVVSVVENLK